MKSNNITIQLAAILMASLLAGCSRQSASVSANPEEQARFLTTVRQAYDKHDTNAIFALYCWDGVSDKDTIGLKKLLVREITEMKVSKMTLVDPDPKIPEDHLNLPVTKLLSIIFVPGGDIASDITPVGKKDGKLYLAGPTPIK